MLQFLKKNKSNNLPLEFSKSMRKLWSTSKNQLYAASHRHLVETDRRTSYEGVWGCLLNLPPYRCRLFLDRVFQRWRLKTTGQVSPVLFSCTKKLFVKLDVNWCYHAFQEDFCCLIFKSISCTIDLQVKQISK